MGLGLLFPHGAALAVGAHMFPTGPSTVNTGQEFQVVIRVNGAVDVDTIRANGSFSQDLLEYRGAKPTGVFQNISPGTYVDQAKGIFSFGAFTLSSKANGYSPLAILTFRAKKAGTAYVQLTTNSRLISAGEDQLGTVGRYTLVVSEKAAPPAQPQPIPSVILPGELIISLRSPTHPDPEKWYATSTVLATWEILGKAIKKTYISFDESPEGATDQREITATSTTFVSPNDGAWYVHLGVDFKDRTFDRADLRILIDTKPPHPIAPIVDQTLVLSNIPNALRFATIDDTSGIERYEIYINGQFVTSTQQIEYPLTGKPPGKYKVEVKAFDRAGNNVSGETDFEILPEIVPVPKRPSLLWLWLILVSVVIVVLGINYWIALGKKNKKRTRRKK